MKDKLDSEMQEGFNHALRLIGREPGEVQTIGRLAGTGNQSFLLDFSDDRIVLRFDGAETSGLVNRELEYSHAKIAAQQALGPQVVAADAKLGILITRYVAGTRFDRLSRPFAQEAMERLANAFVRLQASSGFSGPMDPWQKISMYLDNASLSDMTPKEGLGELWPAIAALRERTVLDHTDLVPCHVDPVPENILDTHTGAVFVDWEYAALSHRLWDAAYFSSEAGLHPSEYCHLLDSLGYRTRLGEFEYWVLTAKAVSLAWCLARRSRAGQDRAVWEEAVSQRHAVLKVSLNRAGLG